RGRTRARGSRSAAGPSLSGEGDSQALAEKPLDRVVDLVPVADLAGDDLRLAGEGLLHVGLEPAPAVGGADLAEAEQVELGQQVVAQDLHAALGVAAVAVLAVGEVEEVHVPRLGAE